MASTYTEGLVIELIGSGDKAGSWGDVTNSNLQALNQGVSGFSDIDLSSVGSSPYTIDLVDAQAVSESTSPSRSSVIRFYGHSDGFQVNFQTNSSASLRINCIIVNGHASNSLVVGTGTGGTVTIPATYSARIHGDGSGLENSFANLAVDKIALKNNEIISNETNDEIIIAADTVKVGDDGAATLSSNGNQNLILKTGNTTTGSITLANGTDGDISITPHNNGKVVMDKVNIGGGEIDGTPIGANSASTGEFTTIESDTITSTNGTLGLSTTGGNKITLTANSSSIDFISDSSGGVNTLSGENTKVVLNTASTNSAGNLLVGQGTGNATVKPGGTGRLNLTSSSSAESAGSEAIHINASAGRIGLEVGEDADLITFRVPLGSAPTTPVFQGFFHQHGFSMHESGGGYLNFSSTTGSTGNGFKADASNDPIEFKAKRDAASNNDSWGRIYHSGMASGDGAYVEVTSSYTGASGAAISFDISSLGVASGDIPRLVELWAKRVSGGDDIGYSEGDWIKLESRFRSGSNDVGYGVWATNSTVNIKAYNQANWLFAPNKSTGADSTLSTAGGWTLYVRAWK